MTELINVFNSPFFIVFSGITTVLTFAGVVYISYLVIKGVFPVLYRLGLGLSKRRIAIFASDQYESLKSMLVDSKIFEEKNIFQVHKNDLKKVQNETLFLLHWKDFQDKLDEILTLKSDSTALIVYAPQSEGRIEIAELNKINDHRNTLIVNFRGRLLNDILSCIITTSYE